MMGDKPDMEAKAQPGAVRIREAMMALPRELFLELKEPGVVLGHSIPPSRAVADILRHAELQPEHRVLQIGTGAGYLVALLSRLVSAVITLENNADIVRVAQQRFNKLRLANITLREGDGAPGAVDLGPFDRIIISTPTVAQNTQLLEQLAPGGLLLAIELSEVGSHILARYHLTELGAPVRRELALVDFSRDSGMTLLDMGMVDRAMLSEARITARQTRQPVINVLRERLNLEDATLYRRLARESNLTFAAVDDLLPQVQPHLMEMFSRSFLDSHHLLPLKARDRTLHLATDDPDASLEEIRQMYPYEQVTKTLVTPNDFKRLWTTVELSLQSLNNGIEQAALEDRAAHTSDLLDSEHLHVEAHLIAVLDALLLDAISEAASDLHIEQYKERTRIRLRVDGDLRDLEHYQLSRRDTRGLVNVIKIRGDMDIAEKRLPQGGRSQLRAGGIDFDLRIQVQPSLYGEAVVVRLLPQGGKLVDITELGMSEPIQRYYRRLLANPSGLVLVVGPTGSGKTTTLYAGLSELARDGRRKVITIEDPIEYSMDNIQQTATHADIGFSFADGMRSFVRQDPDVILVGEIRDHETAQEALRASQTGHVVLSTLHCNDAADSVQRLFDLSVLPNSIASELMAVIAQKLAKRICPDCRQPASPEPAILAELFPDGAPDDFHCFEGSGCEQCGGRGTRGRVGVVEFMQVGPDIREGIALEYPTARLRAVALDCGLVTMRDSALNHVLQGNIPLAEVPRILPAERMAPEKRGQW